MAFWGTTISQSKPYIHSGHSFSGRLRITQATLGLTTKNNLSNDKVIVLCTHGKMTRIPLCTLIPENIESLNLDLEFEGNEEVEISVSGRHTVSLTGYYTAGHGWFGVNEDNLDTRRGGIAETESKGSGDNDSDADDYGYRDKFINDGDPESLSPSPKPKTKTQGFKRKKSSGKRFRGVECKVDVDFNKNSPTNEGPSVNPKSKPRGI